MEELGGNNPEKSSADPVAWIGSGAAIRQKNMSGQAKDIHVTAQGGSDPPGPAGMSGEGTGHPRQQSDCPVHLVDDQAGAQRKATGDEDLGGNPERMLYPFKGRRLARTPPKSRSSSLGDIPKEVGGQNKTEKLPVLTPTTSTKNPPNKYSRTVTSNDGEKDYVEKPENSKRKRSEGTPERATVKLTREDEKQILRRNIEKLIVNIRKLEQVVSESYKPKKELTEISSRLSYQAEQLEKEKTWERLEGSTMSNSGKDKEAQIATQCLECVKASKKAARYKQLKLNETFNNFQSVTEEDWEEGIFPKVEVSKGPTWKSPMDCHIVLPCRENFTSGQKAVQHAINRFGGREGLLKQKKTRGELAQMAQSLGFPDEKGEFTYTHRIIYYPVIYGTEEAEDQNTFQAFKELKAALERAGKEQIAMPELTGIGGKTILRMMEYIFAGSNIKITVYESNESPRNRNENDKKKETRNRNTFALVVNNSNKSYREVLTTVKDAIQENTASSAIRSIRSTKDGKLLIVTDKNEKALEELQNVIQTTSGGMKTKIVGQTQQMEVMHVRGMAIDTTKEEIIGAITQKAAWDNEVCKISDLRPNTNHTLAATIVLKRVDADKILEDEYLTVGLVRCSIERRIKINRCFRCWGYDHLVARCNGPDRTKNCYKCGLLGHNSKECKNEDSCPLCNEAGHKAGTIKCSIFKRVLNKNRKKQAKPYSDKNQMEVGVEDKDTEHQNA